MASVTRQEWADWRDHPITSEFFKQLAKEREEALRRLAAGQFSEEPGRQALMVGMISAFTKILDVEFAEDE